MYVCACQPYDDNPCGLNTICLNVATNVACASNCPAEALCRNQSFDRRTRSKVTIKYFGSKGYGLIASENIAKDTFIIEYLGEIINKKELEKRLKQNMQNYYFMSLGNGLTIDAANYGNESRFINHSCEPNCFAKKLIIEGQTRIGLIAAGEIPKNSELTFNYNWNKKIATRFKYLCGTNSCDWTRE